MIKRLLLLLLFPLSAFATTTVTGNIKNLGTAAVSNNTFVRFYLRGCSGNQPRINGTALIAPTQGNIYYLDMVPNGSGAISGTLYSTRDATGLGNGEIECGGSFTAVWYGVVVFLNGKAGPEMPVHAKNGASFDLSNITPISTTPPVTAPGGDATYFRLDGGNNPITGQIASSLPTGTAPFSIASTTNVPNLNASSLNGATFAAPGPIGSTTASTASFTSANNVILADTQTGATAGAKINACIAALPSTGGICDARGFGATIQTIAAADCPLNIGSATKQVGLIVDPTTHFNVGCTNTFDAIKIFNSSYLECGGNGFLLGGGASIGGFYLTATANVSSLIANGTQDGTQEFMRINGCTFQGNSAATISTALANFKSLFVNSEVSNSTFNGMNSALTVSIDSAAVFTWRNNWVNGAQGTASLSAGGMRVCGTSGPVTIIGGAIEHSTGNKPLLSIDSTACTNPAVNSTRDVAVYNTYFEAQKTGAETGTSNGIEVNNSANVYLHGITCGGTASGTDCVKIIESAGGNSRNVQVQGVDNVVGTFTNTINDTTSTANGTQPMTQASFPRVASYVGNGQTWINQVNLGKLSISSTGITLVNSQDTLGAVTGNGTDQTLYTFTIPANTVQAGKCIRMTAAMTSNNAVAATYKVTLGATTSVNTVNGSANENDVIVELFCNNAGTQNAQVEWANLMFTGYATPQFFTSAENFANALTLKITANEANPNTVTPKKWLLELVQ